jgi:hypothetical protein
MEKLLNGGIPPKNKIADNELIINILAYLAKKK